MEEASFKTTVLSISLALNERKTSDETGVPSRMNNGVFEELMELTPRIRMDTVDIGSPVLESTCIPATIPWSASAAFAAGLSANFDPETEDAEPTTLLIFFAVP